MEKRLFILILIVFAKFSSAQPHLFNLSNSVWTVFEHQTNKYYSQGDTLINSISYAKFYVNIDTFQTHYLKGFMRQDTLQKKVYWLNINSTQEHLLYDFSLNVGDTVEVYPGIYSYLGTARMKVNAIDSLVILGNYHKRFTMENVQLGIMFSEEYWIEGIGSNFGLLMSGSWNAGIHSEWIFPSLMCYTENDTLVFLNQGFISCYLPPIDNVIEVSEDKNISLYPNPTNETLNISNNQNIISYQITLLDGSWVYKGYTFPIKTSQLANGIYFLTTTDKYKQQTNYKFIKN